MAGLYDFPAREYGIQGRWPSPDPTGISSVQTTDPQTWNRYSYVRNNPLTLIDPTGTHLDDCDAWFGCGSGGGGGGGAGGGDYSGGQSGCLLDGVQADCGAMGTNDIAACPVNLCSGFVNGVYIQYQADAISNGFYSCLTTGAFATQQQAGVAAATCAYGPTNYYSYEYGGIIYKNANGTYSFTTPGTSEQQDQITLDPTDIPDGTTYAGFYHDHPGSEDQAGAFSSTDQYIEGMNQINWGFPTYVGGAGRISMYDPFNPFFLNGCVLIGPPVPQIAKYPTTPVPACTP